MTLLLCSYSRNGIWQKDYTLWLDVIKKSPGNPRGLYNLALNLHAQNKLDDALSYLQKIVELKKHNWFVISEIGAIFADMGRFDEALLYHNEALRMSPENPDILDFIGITYVRMNKPERALEFFERSIKIRNDSPATHYYLATLYRDKDLQKSIYHYETALRLNPDYYEAIVDLANLYDEINSGEKAYKLYVRAIKLYPELPEGYFNFGIFFERRGMFSTALKYYEKALILRPDYSEAIEAKERVLKVGIQHTPSIFE